MDKLPNNAWKLTCHCPTIIHNATENKGDIILITITTMITVSIISCYVVDLHH